MQKRTLLIGALLLAACGDDGRAPSSQDQAKVVENYAINLDANYKDVIAGVQSLKLAVDAFVDEPSQRGLDAARQAWLGARPAYGQCEISRFYGGPMDDAQGAMNEWPIDENFIDYTADVPNAGVINHPDEYPEITSELLRAAQERGAIEDTATGFHAIEFLLWGQRPDQTSGPGERPHTDYVDGGSAENQARRRSYLQTATDILLADMQALDAEWDLKDPSSYGATMVDGPAREGLTNMIRGFSNLAITELYYERIMDPFITRDRKDEESCFSESTSTDIIANAKGVEEAYLGKYGGRTGPSVSDLVKALDSGLDARIRSQLSAVRDAIDAIPKPFDHAIIAAETSEENKKVRAAIDILRPLQGLFGDMATLLGVTINL